MASFVLSGILDVELLDPLDVGFHRDTRAARRSLFGLASLRDEMRKVEQDLTHHAHQIGEMAQRFRHLSTTHNALRDEIRRFVMEISEAHDMSPTLIQEHLQEDSPRQVARSVVADILYACSDTQTLAG